MNYGACTCLTVLTNQGLLHASLLTNVNDKTWHNVRMCESKQVELNGQEFSGNGQSSLYISFPGNKGKPFLKRKLKCSLPVI